MQRLDDNPPTPVGCNVSSLCCSEETKIAKLLCNSDLRSSDQGVKRTMEEIRRLIQEGLDDNGQLSCEKAHTITGAKDIDPQKVRELADELGIRIARCQLGLFGHAKEKGMPGFRTARETAKAWKQEGKAVSEVPAEAAKQLSRGGQVTCAELWKIGDAHGVSRFEMGCIAEFLEVSVKKCQLGCF
jgi:hypothetical protein